jgi:electron transport complex protein RnfG
VNEQLETAAAPRVAAPRSGEMIRALAGVAAVSGLVIVVVFQLTQPIIRAKEAKRLREAVFEVVPGAQRVKTFRLKQDGTVAPLAGKDEKAVKFYAGYDAAGSLTGVAIEAQGQGYQDAIKVLYGYAPERQSIVGMKVLESKETPGLGDRIMKDPAFLANFEDLDARLTADGSKLAHPIVTVKKGRKTKRWEIDGITGATISSNAVGRLLDASAEERVPEVTRNLARLKKGK